ncbi:ead/Ea22-like family protein [Enterobacter hormaechei]
MFTASVRPLQEVPFHLCFTGGAKLTLNPDGSATFEGDADEAAQMFFDSVIKLHNRQYQALESAEKRIAELERMASTLRPVGVMSQKAYCRLENRETRFIALWPRPEIYLPRKRPDDGVIVYARTTGIQINEGE